MSLNVNFSTVRLSRGYLESLRDAGKKLSLNLIGMVFVDDDVTTELIEDTVSDATIHGRIIANPDVRRSLQSINAARRRGSGAPGTRNETS